MRVDRLKWAIEHKGLKNKDVAAYMNVSPAAVSRWGIERHCAAMDIGRVRPVLRPVVKFREAFSTLPTRQLYHVSRAQPYLR